MASTEHPVALQDPVLLKTSMSPTFPPMPSQCSGPFTGSSMLLSAGFECPSSTPRPLWPSPLRWTEVWTDSHLGKRRCPGITGPWSVLCVSAHWPSFTCVGAGAE